MSTIPKDTSMPQLATILENLGKRKKTSITHHLSEETGLNEKEIKKSLPGVQSAFRGAEVAQAQGMDPHKVGIHGLKKMDPAAQVIKQEKKQVPQNKKDINNQELITVALLSTLPSLVATALGGTRAGQITAEGSSKIGGMYAEQKRYEDKQDQRNKERGQDLELKKKGLAVQQATAEALSAKRSHEMSHRDKMVALKEREVTAKEQKLGQEKDQNGNPILKPTKLTSQQTSKLTQLQAARAMLEDAKKVIIANKDAFSSPGMIGKMGNIKNAMKVNNPQLQSIDTMLRKTALLTGQGIKGGSLTQEEGHQWENELQRSLPVETLLTKIEIFEKQVADQEHAFLKSAEINRQPVPGYEPAEKKELSISQGYPVEKVEPSIEEAPMPDFKKMTPEELKKYLGK